MNTRYNAADIEVLSGLDPVKRRPGMYTDTTRPNHLAQEVIDNSVDEALGGHAKLVEVTVFADGSVEVADDGPGFGGLATQRGLGLQNVRLFATGHDGALTWGNSALGGALVVLRLPRLDLPVRGVAECTA